jgi:alpha-L-fucosidase
LAWGRCTTKISGNKTTLYLHVFDWPADGELLVPGLMNHVKSASLLAGGKQLRVENREDGVAISVPAEAPDKISSTIVLRFAGAPEIVTAAIAQKHDGSVPLPAVAANLHGNTFKYESGGPLDDIGYWTNPDDWADWDLNIKQPGKFRVVATIAAPAVTSFELSVAGQTFHFTTPATADYVTFTTTNLGLVDIPAAGKVTLAVHPVKDGWQPMNLKSIELTAVGADDAK